MIGLVRVVSFPEGGTETGEVDHRGEPDGVQLSLCRSMMELVSEHRCLLVVAEPEIGECDHPPEHWDGLTPVGGEAILSVALDDFGKFTEQSQGHAEVGMELGDFGLGCPGGDLVEAGIEVGQYLRSVGIEVRVVGTDGDGVRDAIDADEVGPQKVV